MKKIFLYIATVLASGHAALSQQQDPCLQQVLLYESRLGSASDSAAKGQNLFLSYAIKATSWQNESTVSNVKLYRMGKNLNLFSEQASIYMDEENVLIVMPEQKVVIMNSANPQDATDLKDDFFEAKKNFLITCEVMRCETKDSNHGILALKPGKQAKDKRFQIESMSYEFDPLAEKIIRVTINYERQYKLRQMVMTYKEFDAASTYRFLPVKAHFADKKGGIKEAFKGFEIVDNRDKKNAKGKS